MKIYMLSAYAEAGSEGVVATANRLEVEDLLDKYFNQYALDAENIHLGNGEYISTRERLRRSLVEDKESRQPINLSAGWGGIQLHIIKLYKGN